MGCKYPSLTTSVSGIRTPAPRMGSQRLVHYANPPWLYPIFIHPLFPAPVLPCFLSLTSWQIGLSANHVKFAYANDAAAERERE